jgi:hypothetical protein
MNVRCIAAWIAICTLRGGLLAQTPPASAPAALDPQVEEILTRLETRQLTDLKCNVDWSVRTPPEEDGILKSGDLWYRDEPAGAKFKVEFRRQVSGQRRDQLDEQHLFDGRWYVELQGRAEIKTVTRREIRAAEDRRNPYKLGEGAFPLPFGQKKADILREFEVTLLAASKTDPEKSDRLHLVPRKDTHTFKTYKSLDCWVARDGPLAGLPVQVLCVKRDPSGRSGSEIKITFKNVELNAGISSAIFQIATPSGFRESIETLQDAEPLSGEVPASEPSKP